MPFVCKGSSFFNSSAIFESRTFDRFLEKHVLQLNCMRMNKIRKQNARVLARREDWPSCSFAELLPLLCIQYQWVTKTTGGRMHWVELHLQLGTTVFRLLKVITGMMLTFIYKVLFDYLDYHLCAKVNIWWFLLNMLFYRLSINLKGTKCLALHFHMQQTVHRVNLINFPNMWQ